MKTPSTSALIVFETLPPYGRESVTILALPHGCQTRFRYKLKWFDHNKPIELKGLPCLIALRHTVTAEIVPLRYCSITSVEEIGEIYYLIVTLGSFVEYNTGKEGQKHQIDRFQELLRDKVIKDIDNTPGKGMEKLVFNTPDYSSVFGNPHYTANPSGRDIAAWGTIVERLIEMREFEPFDFLHISILDEKRTPLKVKNGQFFLRGKRYYKVAILQRRKHVEPPREIIIRLDRNQLTPVLDRQLAVGAYDVLEFSFYTSESSSRQKQSSLVVSTDSISKGTEVFPHITVPVTIIATHLLTIILPSLVFLFSASALVAPEFVSSKLGIPKELITTDLHNILILLAILTASSAGKIGSLIIEHFTSLG